MADIQILSEVVQCPLCKNDIMMSLKMDGDVEAWEFSVDITTVNKWQRCCKIRIQEGVDNMVGGCEWYLQNVAPEGTEVEIEVHIKGGGSDEVV